MSYWLTTHWPRPQDTPASEPYADVWVKNGQLKVIRKLDAGDMIFIYESKSGPLPLRHNPDGSTYKAPRAAGKEGIVALVRVTHPAKQPSDSVEAQYDNGQKMWWRYRAPTEPVNSGGFIPRTVFLPLIGQNPAYTLRGFGENHSGVKQLTARQFTALRNMYEASADRKDRKRVESNTRGGQFGGQGGEGDVHRDLKERIAADPSAVLGEDGLSLHKVEFPFNCTGDRIDVVLRDKDKRFVAVEVEVECDRNHLAGALQCMKYRAMLAYYFERPLEEVRCILAAHNIASEVNARCAAFEIETIMVARPISPSTVGSTLPIGSAAAAC
jgi:hypothetical protein